MLGIKTGGNAWCTVTWSLRRWGGLKRGTLPAWPMPLRPGTTKAARMLKKAEGTCQRTPTSDWCERRVRRRRCFQLCSVLPCGAGYAPRSQFQSRSMTLCSMPLSRVLRSLVILTQCVPLAPPQPPSDRRRVESGVQWLAFAALPKLLMPGLWTGLGVLAFAWSRSLWDDPIGTYAAFTVDSICPVAIQVEAAVGLFNSSRATSWKALWSSIWAEGM